MKRQFSSEAVTCGHPDKVCDQVADAILDAILAKDPEAHVACEVTAKTDSLCIFGEISTTAQVDMERIARQVIREIGYTEPGHGFDADTCRIQVEVHEQSPDIAQGIRHADAMDNGAGDQGMMFGFACTETPDRMPLPIELANRMARRLEDVRRTGLLPYLLPDGKTQITVEYEDGVPRRIVTAVLSAQHTEEVSLEQLREDILHKVMIPSLPAELLDENAVFFANPAGRFVVGGPAGDSGLTGRKIIADTYGGYARHGGGAFSGKDPSKVDRSGAYLARYIAKNVVAAGWAEKCEVQLGYAIGLAEPVNVFVETFGTQHIAPERIRERILRDIDMRPAAIAKRLGLQAPIYRRTACYGHFGENTRDLPWEKTDLARQWAQEEG